MNVHVFQSYAGMSDAAAAFIVSKVRSRPDLLLCLPSGETPTATLEKLVGCSATGEVDLSHARFVGLDEWVGMDRSDPGSCQHYVYHHFFDPAGIRDSRITFFNAKADDLQAECKRINDFIIDHGPLDLVMVGVGLNGHIGLNEPGVSPLLNAHVVELENSTRQVAQKYFFDNKVLEKGITLGLAQIMNARTVVVIANGIKKSGIIQKIVEGPVTVNVPGSILQRHPNCHLFLDQEAASKLTVI